MSSFEADKKILCAVFLTFLLVAGGSVQAGSTSSLSWNDCVREAIDNNPELAGSAQSIKKFKASQWVTTSPALPHVSTKAGAGRSNSFSGDRERNENSYSIKGEQLVFDGFKTISDIKSSKELVKASKYGYTATSSEIRYNLRTAFVDLMRAQALVPVTKSIIDRRKQNLSMIKLKYESGREHEGSLLLAEADLAQAQYDFKKAQRDISVAEYALKKQLGRNDDSPIRVIGTFTVKEASDKMPNLRTLAENHPLVNKLESEVKSARYDLDSSAATFSPVVKLNAEAGKIKPMSLSASEHGWSAGIDLSLPLFEGGNRIANVRKTRAAYLQAEFNSQSRYDDVLSTLEKAWQNFQDAQENALVQEKYLNASEVRAKISRAEYANGLLIFDNWIIIEDNFIKIQKAYINAQAEMLASEAAWIKAKGGYLEYQ